MLTQWPLLAALVLLQDSPQEARGLKVLWVPQATTAAARTPAGFTFSHPITRQEVCIGKAKDFQAILEKMPAPMKTNGIWISTTNAFLYSDEENRELKALVAIARAQNVYVFMCELPLQPLGWRKVDD